VVVEEKITFHDRMICVRLVIDLIHYFFFSSKIIFDRTSGSTRW